ncbi:MAG TPA: hypothetical protein VFQ77_09365 [Pseudonocardiaceae bacterium]|jgi:hypothetical protein|nr:hypothetical protein [Pseudonocardiaceae bacterium]
MTACTSSSMMSGVSRTGPAHSGQLRPAQASARLYHIEFGTTTLIGPLPWPGVELVPPNENSHP